MTLGLYLHVPFCARRCDYCDFFVVIPAGEPEDEAGFPAWLRRDLTQAIRALPGRPEVDTIYFGGGTPSRLPPAEIRSILEAAARGADVAPQAEVTLEANPEDVTPARAGAWGAAGITRVSLGVQSLADDVLRPRGRRYTGGEALAAIRLLREARFESIGVDLIAGLPGETRDSFLEGIDRLLDAPPDHLSIYLLELEESGKETPLARGVAEGRVAVPAEEETLAMFDEACRRLESAGLHRYEISNFAREGKASLHNLKYWTSAPWLGVGPSAHSHVGGRRFGRPAGMAAWRDWVAGGGEIAAQEYTLAAPAERAREALVMELRLVRGVLLDPFASRWGYDPREDRAADLAEMAREGLIEMTADRIRLTARGMLLSNDLFARLT